MHFQCSNSRLALYHVSCFPNMEWLDWHLVIIIQYLQCNFHIFHIYLLFFFLERKHFNNSQFTVIIQNSCSSIPWLFHYFRAVFNSCNFVWSSWNYWYGKDNSILLFFFTSQERSVFSCVCFAIITDITFFIHILTFKLDGYIARNFKNQKSVFGTILDPIADKVLMSVLVISLTVAELLPSMFHIV